MHPLPANRRVIVLFAFLDMEELFWLCIVRWCIDMLWALEILILL
jgi:hypothetical protein